LITLAYLQRTLYRNDQENGENIDINYFEYSLENGKMTFCVNKEIDKKYKNITLLFEPKSSLPSKSCSCLIHLGL
jgi:hypothetical protein